MSSMQMRTVPLWIAILFAGTACDLDVVNTNQPDRARALAQAKDVEALVGGTFSVFFAALHNQAHTVNLIPSHATEMTGTATTGGVAFHNVEPRPAYDNSPTVPAGSGPLGPRMAWASLMQMGSSVHDGLRTIEERELVITEGTLDVTPRAKAFAKFMQGMAWGYLAIMFDQPIALHEDVPLENDTRAQSIALRAPWEDVLDMSIASIEEAIAIAQASPFTLPSYSASKLFFATPAAMSSADFIKLANTVAARILVLSARNPAGRKEVDWAKVLAFTANGLTADFEVQLASGFRTSLLYQRMEANTAGCSDCFRWATRLIGPSDVSGAYQAWLALPIAQRDRFNIVTPDRRITGATPTSDGSYTKYRADDNGFPAAKGLYTRSAYQWQRQTFRGFSTSTGTAKMASADENRLLRAEALIRTGNSAAAVDLINVSRTRSQTAGGVTYVGLPAVTVAGVPQSATCVPRTDSGACGDLMAALRYERMLELALIDSVRGWADSRGFGILPDGSWLQLPIPGNELDVLGLSLYTFGGVGSEWGAVYAPITMQGL